MNEMSGNTFSIHYQPSKAARIFAAVLLFSFPLIMLAVMVFSKSAAASESAVWINAVVIGLLVCAAGFLWSMLHHNTIECDGTTLKVHTSFYRFEKPLALLRAVHPQPIGLPELGPLMWKKRRNAFSIPGFQSGRFNLQNGRKAFLSVVNFEVVVYAIEDGSDFLLMLGPPECERLADYLQSRIKAA
jgi:hypothetical protein